MTRYILLSLRYAFTRWQIHRLTRHVDRRIKEAPRNHKPVRHLIAEKVALVHSPEARA